LYGSDLATKPEIVELNKVDLPGARERAKKLNSAFGEDQAHRGESRAAV
jgi:GTPase involved in cell partitioning and DNA repair